MYKAAIASMAFKDIIRLMGWNKLVYVSSKFHAMEVGFEDDTPDSVRRLAKQHAEDIVNSINNTDTVVVEFKHANIVARPIERGRTT